MSHQADPTMATVHSTDFCPTKRRGGKNAHHSAWAPAGGYAKFIGRVGVLALFLGVGGAVALALPASALADDGGVGSSESSSPAGVSSAQRSADRQPALAEGASANAPTRKTSGSPMTASTSSERLKPGASSTSSASAKKTSGGVAATKPSTSSATASSAPPRAAAAS